MLGASRSSEFKRPATVSCWPKPHGQKIRRRRLLLIPGQTVAPHNENSEFDRFRALEGLDILDILPTALNRGGIMDWE
jgi:hypothetical protein